MEQDIQTRLASLKEEFEKGQQMLAEAELRQRQLAETLLRISGAIQVLEEMVSTQSSGNGAPQEVPEETPAAT